MAYTTINKSSDYFNTKLYTGNGGTQSITGVGFQPDFTWIKNRSDNWNNVAYDAVRGVTKQLVPNENSAESTNANGLTAFGSDGFTVGNEGTVNYSSENLVAWNWKAGTTTVPTGGSLDATAVSINTTSGFGIYKYTGNGAGVRSIAHGLGAIPKMFIVKRLDSTRDWAVYNASLPLADHLELNNTDAATGANLWWSSRPTSSLIYFNADGQVNFNNSTYIMYAFTDVQGFSKFSSYIANGSSTDGTFVYTGFKPAFVIIKQTNASGEAWIIKDNKRGSFNQNDPTLFTSANSAESNREYIDFLSNGFKCRDNSSAFNAPGSTYTFMAFAEAPLVGSNNVPCTAR